MFEQTFKNIDDVLWKEAGCTTELDYTEQTSWLLFLKYLDDLEQERASKAELEGKSYEYIIDPKHRWSKWAAPKKKDGSFDHDKALIGDDLIDYINRDLFPYLQGFRQRATGPDTIEYKIGEIFSEIKNRFQSGYSLRDAVEYMDGLRFRSQTEKHELSHIYEAKIKNMGNAGRNGGEYYTPRPLIRAMVQVIKPKIGERIYDGACGSAGFLCESYDYLRQGKLSTKQLETLQTKTFYGKEKKSLAYVIAIMNMILHGIDAPNVIHTNTLSENSSDIQEKDRFDVILANPPFGGKERPEVQQNFSIRTAETASLFLQHFIKSLKSGGRAAVVIKTTFLSNSDSATRSLREELLSVCSVHTILDCPKGTFLGTGEKTVVLFFEKGFPTKNIWYYQLNPERNLGKTNPLNDGDLEEFVEFQARFAASNNSWTIRIEDISTNTFNLAPKNPNSDKEPKLDSPMHILSMLKGVEQSSVSIYDEISECLLRDSDCLDCLPPDWDLKKLGDVLKLEYGKPLEKDRRKDDGIYPAYGANGVKCRTDECYWDKPSIIIGRKGSAGEVNLAEDAFWPLDVTYFVIFDENEYDLLFIYYCLKNLRLQTLAKGVKPGINRNDVYEIECPFPKLPEQKRIVKYVGILQAKIDELRVLNQERLEGLSEFNQSVLQNAFSGGISASSTRDRKA